MTFSVSNEPKEKHITSQFNCPWWNLYLFYFFSGIKIKEAKKKTKKKHQSFFRTSIYERHDGVDLARIDYRRALENYILKVLIHEKGCNHHPKLKEAEKRRNTEERRRLASLVYIRYWPASERAVVEAYFDRPANWRVYQQLWFTQAILSLSRLWPLTLLLLLQLTLRPIKATSRDIQRLHLDGCTVAMTRQAVKNRNQISLDLDGKPTTC